MTNKNEKVTMEEMSKYTSAYSDEGLLEKIGKYAKQIGLNLMYEVLLLWYVLDKEDLPADVKFKIYAALGYFISPIDIVPDVLPVVGYTDDAVAVGLAFGIAHMYVDEDVRRKAKAKIDDIFGAGTSNEL